MLYKEGKLLYNIENILAGGVRVAKFIEITKPQARERYNDGKIIRLLASNLNPNGYWGEPLPINNEQGKSFEKICSEFMYYNCSVETGKNIKFYIKREDK